jgi:hypothetical protein
MKKSKFTESQIVKALKEEENGRSAIDISRVLGINKQTFPIQKAVFLRKPPGFYLPLPKKL